MRKIVIIVLCLVLIKNIMAQNVGINTTGATPHNSAMLDVDASNKGLLIPRVALTGTNDVSTITSPATSLMVYNTATAGSGTTAVTPGYYYWGGSAWIRVATDGDSWKTIGNSGTNPSTNFLGTTDANDFLIKTNNIDRVRIMNDGSTQNRIGFGTNSPTQVVSGGTSTMMHIHDSGNTANDFAQLILGSHKTVNNSFLGVINFAATQTGGERRIASLESHMITAGANPTGDLRFFTTETGSHTEKMRIDGNGQVSIATTIPTTNYLLTVNPTTNALRSGISIPMSGATSTAFGINITAANGNSRGLFYSNSTTASGVVYGVGSEITGGVPVSGYLSYRTGSPNNYGVFGITGTNATYNSTNANAWAGFFQGRVVISGETSPTSLIGTDLEIRNTTTGAGNPVVLSMRQSTSNATNGSVLTQLNFGDNYSTSPQAAIFTIRDAAGGAGDNPTALLFGTTPDGSSTLTERMRINNAGNVGIGTTTPSRRLHVADGSGIIASSSTSVIAITSMANTWATHDSYVFSNSVEHPAFVGLRARGNISSPAYPQLNDVLLSLTGRDAIDGYSSLNYGGATINFISSENWSSSAKGAIIQFLTTNNGTNTLSEKARITNQGNFLIGTTTAGARLHVVGTGQNIARIQTGGSFHNDWPVGWGGGIETWDICGASTFMTQNILRSDIRYKKNINNISTAIAQINKLRPVSYNMLPELESDFKEHLHFGFIAQEVEAIFPNLVVTTTNGYKGLNYTELIPILTKAIQEQQAIIESQKSEMEQLKKKSIEIDNLKAEIEFIKSQLNADKQSSNR
ncbi:MAG: hypothetical protein KatS3mg027_1845 [Bacteroidia bacterium]|nr:MAG: hypothetical protein KatS3mg027_1845 [Bacteroidia bacterium]